MEQNSAGWNFWFIAIGVMIVGAAGIVVSTVYKFHGADLLRALAEALLIAGFLSATVDRYVKWRLLHETSTDISKYLIGYQLPRQAQERIKELMGTKLIRQNYTVRYTFTPMEDRMQVQVILSWNLLNLTSEKQPYHQDLNLEEHDDPQVLVMECDSSDISAKYSWDAKEIARHVKREKGILNAQGKHITVKPNSEPGGDIYNVSATCVLITSQEYSDVIAFGAPSTNLTILVTIPEAFMFSAPGADTSTAGQWRYNKFFMTGEHVRVRWWPRQE